MILKDDEEYQKTKYEFETYMDQIIIPKLSGLEVKRKKYLSLLIVTTLFAITWLILAFMKIKENDFLSSSYGLAGCMIILGICIPMFSWYKQTKENILPLIINFFGTFEYNYKPEISLEIMNKFIKIKKNNLLELEDGFKGNYENVAIEIKEYTIYDLNKYKQDNCIKTNKRLYRHGIIFQAQMNKKFNGETIIRKDKGILNNFINEKNKAKVSMESIEFEKAYEVYSDNQIEARYILTTVMLEYMMLLKDIFPKTEFLFTNEMVFINIIIKENMFECSSFFKSIINKKNIGNIFTQFYLLFAIIKILRLNQQKLL